MTWCWTVIRTHYLHGDEQMRYVLNNGRFYWTRSSLFKKDISHNNFLGVWQLWSFSENYSHFLDIKGRADIFLFQWLAATSLAACRFTAGASNFHFKLKRKGKNIFFPGAISLEKGEPYQSSRASWYRYKDRHASCHFLSRFFPNTNNYSFFSDICETQSSNRKHAHN